MIISAPFIVTKRPLASKKKTIDDQGNIFQENILTWLSILDKGLGSLMNYLLGLCIYFGGRN